MARSTHMKGVPRDSDYLPDGQARCTATSKQSRRRCQRAATPGGTVCATHGGKAPQVKLKARLRLSDLVDPAIVTLAKELTSTTNKPGDRIRAAENILDRAGYGRQIDNGNVDLARALLVNKLLTVQSARREKEPDMIVEGEIVEDDLL